MGEEKEVREWIRRETTRNGNASCVSVAGMALWVRQGRDRECYRYAATRTTTRPGISPGRSSLRRCSFSIIWIFVNDVKWFITFTSAKVRLWLSVCDASRRPDRSPSQQAGRVAGRVTGRWRAAKISKQPSKQIDREDR